MRISPSQLFLQTILVLAGVMVTYLQVEAIVSWQPTVGVHLGMGLAAAGILLSVPRTLVRKHRQSE